MPVRLARGERVGERYRLERELGSGTDCVTWEALDERLDRSVALRIFDSGLDRISLTKRAGLAASLTHPRVVRVFDTGQDGARFFTVSELLPESLGTVRLPLSPQQLLPVAIDIAEALDYAHERGVTHGHLHEGNVLISESGSKVGDFALGVPVEERTPDADLRAFGALLERVSRPTDADEPGFTRVIEGLAGGGYGSAAAALDDLRRLRPRPPAPTQRPTRRLWPALIVAVLVGVTVLGVLRLGGRSPNSHLVVGGKISGTAVHAVSVVDFDPQGDGREGHATVGNIDDGDPQTFWSTERYTHAPDFSGLPRPKSGVGVIFDMGRRRAIGKAQILLAAPGCSFQIRYADIRSDNIDDWAKAASVNASPLSAPLVFHQATARYWLLWITRLTTNTPGARGLFACGVAEVEFFAP